MDFAHYHSALAIPKIRSYRKEAERNPVAMEDHRHPPGRRQPDVLFPPSFVAISRGKLVRIFLLRQFRL